MLVLLDASPLGKVSNPTPKSQDTVECAEWLKGLLEKGVDVRVPEIADYEIRRELLLGEKTQSVERLDELKEALGYVPLTTEMMMTAAQMWADIRKQGLPTAHDHALDGDVILAAQAEILSKTHGDVMVATENLKHLNRLTMADEWKNISG